MKTKKLLASILLLITTITTASAQKMMRVIVAGLTHDHVHGILNQYGKGQVDIVGVAEADQKLWDKWGKMYKLPQSLFGADLKAMVVKLKPDAVLAYNPVGQHIDVVEVCAPLKVPVMVEKPLAATLEQAKRIEVLANKYKVKVLTNYETTWFPTFKEVYDIATKDSLGVIRKMVVHDGHKGPREIGCSEDFLGWLTDPDATKNGAGALNDFGCYGADLMTWLMKGQKPIAVTAIARHYKPAVYPKVEDDATILLEYPNATGQIEASWNWPFNIKDLEISGSTGYVHAFDRDNLLVRLTEKNVVNKKSLPLASPYNDYLPYLEAVLSGKIDDRNDQASLKYNMVVMQILDAAKRSIKEGKRIVL